MRCIVLLALLPFVVSGCGKSPTAQGPIRKDTYATWQPEQELLKQLEGPTVLDTCSIQLPPKFTNETKKSNLKTPNSFAGPFREDLTRASIVIATQKKQEYRQEVNAARALSESLEDIKRRRRNFEESPTELGMIGEVQFARKRWKGNDLSTNVTLHGVMYCASAENHYYTISLQDIADANDDQFELAEAAALTFLPGE